MSDSAAYYLRVALIGDQPIRAFDDLAVLRACGVLRPEDTISVEEPDWFVDIPCEQPPPDGFGFYVTREGGDPAHFTFGPSVAAFEGGPYQDDARLGIALPAALRFAEVFPTVDENLLLTYRLVVNGIDSQAFFARLVGPRGVHPPGPPGGIGLDNGRLHLFYRGAALGPWPEVVIQPVAAAFNEADPAAGVILSVVWDPIQGSADDPTRHVAAALRAIDRHIEEASAFASSIFDALDLPRSQP